MHLMHGILNGATSVNGNHLPAGNGFKLGKIIHGENYSWARPGKTLFNEIGREWIGTDKQNATVTTRCILGAFSSYCQPIIIHIWVAPSTNQFTPILQKTTKPKERFVQIVHLFRSKYF
jgi:hypothetical protein